MRVIWYFSVGAALAAFAAGAHGEMTKLGPRAAKPQHIAVTPLTSSERELSGSGAFCQASDLQGRVLYSATDAAVIKINGRIIRLQMGNAAWSSNILLAYDKSYWVQFEPRAGRSKTGIESQTDPMTMKVGHRDKSISLPVMRECGA